MSLPSQPFLNLQKELAKSHLERDEVIEGLLCAVISGQHLLLIGPPGTGKSDLVHDLCRRLDGLTYFQWLLTRFTTPEELFGPVSLRSLEADLYVRVTQGKLPTAHLAFLDEVFKASSAILNTLLALMNERVFHNGFQPTPAPLISLIGATNELPDEDELLALSDRFLLRYQVGYLQEDFLFLRMLTLEDTAAETRITPTELRQMRDRATAVEVPDAIKRDLLELRKHLGAKGVVASDRRYRQCLAILRARAALRGRDRCQAEDLRILSHVLWTAPSEKVEVDQAIDQLFTGHDEDARRLLFQAREVFQLPARAAKEGLDGDDATAEALAKLNDLARRLDQLAEATVARGRTAERIADHASEVRHFIDVLLRGSRTGAEPRH